MNDRQWTLFALPLLLVACGAAKMQPVRISPDNKGFIVGPAGEKFVPWGHNYASEGLEGPPSRPWEKIESDFVELKKMGANVARIHLQFPRFMDGPDKPNAAALKRLNQLLELAQKHGLYLDLTGLACYRPQERAAWYDAMSDEDRWATQGRFWESVAATCAKCPAVFCYDLANEPVVAGQRKDGWYTGRLGGLDFLQRLSLDQRNRPLDEIALQWTRQMVAAIRKQDRTHLITIGMLPAWGVSPKAVGPELDFIAVHIYPETGKVDEAMRTLKRFDVGKPIVVEETFPLACGVPDLRQFLLRSRGLAAGWIGHYGLESPPELEALRQSKKLTLPQAMYLSWFDLFREIGPKMTGQAKPAR
jgi:hypothetical protein